MTKTYNKIFQLLIVIVLIGIIIFSAQKGAEAKKSAALNTFVIQKMTECKNNGDVMCWRNIAHIFATEYPLKDVLHVFENNEKNPVFFGNCHTTLHFLGQEAYKMKGSTSKAISEGTPACFAGFYHGVLEAYMTQNGLLENDSRLAVELPTLCSAQENAPRKVYNECLHGLGHALMFATDNDLPKSLKLCDILSTDIDRQWCYSGSFMENSTSSTNPDHPSQYLKKDDPLYPCDALAPKYLHSCYTLQSFYFAELAHYDWIETGKMCKNIPKEYQPECFNAIGQSIIGSTQDEKKIKADCDLFTDVNDRTNCLYGAIGAIGERYEDGWNRNLNFCNNILTDESDKNNCFDRVIQMRNDWIQNPRDRKTFCNNIQSKDKRAECLQSI